MVVTRYDFDHPGSSLVVHLQWSGGGWRVEVRNMMEIAERGHSNRWVPGQYLPYTTVPLDEFLKQAERDFGLASKAMG